MFMLMLISMDQKVQISMEEMYLRLTEYQMQKVIICIFPVIMNQILFLAVGVLAFTECVVLKKSAVTGGKLPRIIRGRQKFVSIQQFRTILGLVEY